ncbi:Na+-dependent transporter, partial [Sesbania bispinosa]
MGELFVGVEVTARGVGERRMGFLVSRLGCVRDERGIWLVKEGIGKRGGGERILGFVVGRLVVGLRYVIDERELGCVCVCWVGGEKNGEEREIEG